MHVRRQLTREKHWADLGVLHVWMIKFCYINCWPSLIIKNAIMDFFETCSNLSYHRISIWVNRILTKEVTLMEIEFKTLTMWNYKILTSIFILRWHCLSLWIWLNDFFSWLFFYGLQDLRKQLPGTKLFKLPSHKWFCNIDKLQWKIKRFSLSYLRNK